MNIKQGKSIKARLATAIIVALIAAAATISAAVIAYSATTYQTRHNDKSISSGKTGSITYGKSSSSKTATFDLSPSTGNLYISLIQTTGNSSMKYVTKYKKSSVKSYTTIKTFSFSKNNVWSSEKKAGKVKKGTKYNMAITKTAGVGTKSKIKCDWLLK